MGNCCYLFCSGNDSVNAGVQDPEERDERVKRASAYGTERLLSVILREGERERAAANPSSGRSFRHYDIKRIHTPYYTEHSKKAFGKQCFCSFEHACQHFK